MRNFAYVIAALAAVGIVVGVALMPASPTKDTNSPASSTPAVATGENVMNEPGQLVMRVPEMHCPFACYPAVKSTLEGDANVASVELMPQKDENLIDNPEIVINYKAGFDVNAAIASLASKGFKDSAIAQ